MSEQIPLTERNRADNPEIDRENGKPAVRIGLGP